MRRMLTATVVALLGGNRSDCAGDDTAATAGGRTSKALAKRPGMEGARNTGSPGT